MPNAQEGLPRLAVVGCGAITESFYLPVLEEGPEVHEHIVFVDPNLRRAREMAKRFDAAAVTESHGEILGEIDAAIVAVPPRLHRPVAGELLAAGIHVLCEKPLAAAAAGAEELVGIARESDAVLAVNNTRRLFPASRRVKESLEAGSLGRIDRVEYQEGGEFSWPAASGSYFSGDRGVLLDRGAHVLDLVCWWMGGEPEVVEYRDDSRGGTEAVAQLVLSWDDVEGEVWLSWLTKRANRYRIVGDQGAIEGDIYERDRLRVVESSGQERTVRVPGEASSFSGLAFPLLENFLKAVAGEAEPIVSGADVLPSIRLIDHCYSYRSRFQLSWERDLEEMASGV